jgi:hypothetical protein
MLRAAEIFLIFEMPSMTDKIIGRASLGVFLLRYGSYFPYTSLFIQSLKATHYVSLERNIDDVKV